MSLIIIEGVDRTGKTTLANKLVDHFSENQERHTRLLHFGPPKSGALREYLDPILDYDPRVDDVIIDRFHLGELVWPHFFDREPRITQSERGLIELFLHSRGAVVIHCTRDVLGLRKAFREADPPEPLPEEKIFEALNRFKEVVDDCAVPVVEYRQGNDISELIKMSMLTSVIASRECTETGGISE